jgi:hypothetical protein
MNLLQAEGWARRLRNASWYDDLRTLGRSVRSAPRTESSRLLIVGHPEDQPWHLTAHLDEESRLSGIGSLMPTLIRWSPPPDAPAHLRVGLSRLEAARRGETLFVVTPESAPVPLLERVSDARRVGATILALDQGDPELDSLAHETLSVLPWGYGGVGSPPGGTVPVLSFDAAQHLVSAAAGERDGVSAGTRGGRGVRGLRDRLARLLDAVSGPSG